MLSLRLPAANFRLRGYFAAVVLVLVGIGAALVFRRLPNNNLSLLFLLVVLIAAAGWGLGPSILASLLSFLTLNFLFTPPYFTLSVAEDNDLATLFFFLAAAVLTGKLAARMRSEAAGNRAGLERLSILLEFSRRMSAAQDVEHVLEALVQRIAAVTSAPVAALLPDDTGRLTLRAQKLLGRQHIDVAEARQAWHQSGDHAVRRGEWVYLPLGAPGKAIGLVAVGTTQMQHQQRQLADALCEQAAIAVERTRLVDDLRSAQLESETERLRSALLSSISHDLRTPLAAIIGSATSILEYGSSISPDDARELLETIRSESDRLDRYIQNLLDMTRLDQQHVELTTECVDLNDLLASAVRRLGAALTPFRLRSYIEPEAALVVAHRALLEQLLVNLLDNAAGFSPAGSDVLVRVHAEPDRIVIEVTDRGPGIPEDERDRIFEPFYRTRQGDRSRSGTGLGLAICRSVAVAHGGTIEALPNPGGGTCLRVTLPRRQELPDYDV